STSLNGSEIALRSASSNISSGSRLPSICMCNSALGRPSMKAERSLTLKTPNKPLIPAKAGTQEFYPRALRLAEKSLGPRWSLSSGSPPARPGGGDERNLVGDGCGYVGKHF